MSVTTSRVQGVDPAQFLQSITKAPYNFQEGDVKATKAWYRLTQSQSTTGQEITCCFELGTPLSEENQKFFIAAVRLMSPERKAQLRPLNYQATLKESGDSPEKIGLGVKWMECYAGSDPAAARIVAFFQKGECSLSDGDKAYFEQALSSLTPEIEAQLRSSSPSTDYLSDSDHSL